MSVKVKHINPEGDSEKDPILRDEAFVNRETTVDGYTFHWSPGLIRNFLDDGVGAAHGAFHGNATVTNPVQVERKFTGSEFS